MSEPDKELFKEAFRIRSYTGDTTELGEKIEEKVNGVKSVFVSASQNPSYAESESVDVDIKYDPIETDRTQVSDEIEEFDGVDSKVTSA